MHNKILDIQYWLTVTEEQLQKKKKVKIHLLLMYLCIHNHVLWYLCDFKVTKYLFIWQFLQLRGIHQIY